MSQESIIANFLRINDNFNTVHLNENDIWKAILKNKRKIKGLRGAVVFLAFGCIFLAAELAERKRSENYLKEEIDDLKEAVYGDEADSGGSDNETNGGAADA